MALQFQAPGFVRPVDYSGIPKSIDDLFSAYQQGKQQGLQNQVLAAQAQTAQTQAQYAPQIAQTQLATAQQGLAAAQADFALSHEGLSPQDVNGGLASMYASPVPNSPMGPGQPQPAPDAKQQTVQHILHMHQAAQVAAAQQQQAVLFKTQVEGANAALQFQQMGGNPAALQNPGQAPITAQGAVNPINDHVQNILALKEDPSMPDVGRGDQGNALRVGVANALAKMGINKTDLQAKYDAKQAGAKSAAQLTEGGSSQEMARSANSAYKQFDLLQKASDNFSRTNNQLINTPLLKIDSTKYPEAQVFKTALSTARIEYARAASGSKSPSDTFMAEAKSALPDGITPAQIGPVLDQLRNSLSEQTRGQLTPATIGNAPPLIQGAPKSAAPTGKILLKAPDGTRGYFPAGRPIPAGYSKL